jgi:uncharacterized protein YjbI with pentapeptide repeats
MTTKRSVSELLSRYASGDRSFAETELETGDGDLGSKRLDDADFSRSWISASFRNASLRRVSFRGANLKSCDFRGADPTGADFTDAALEAATWAGAILAGAQFGDVRLFGAELTEAEFLALIRDSD